MTHVFLRGSTAEARLAERMDPKNPYCMFLRSLVKARGPYTRKAGRPAGGPRLTGAARRAALAANKAARIEDIRGQAQADQVLAWSVARDRQEAADARAQGLPREIPLTPQQLTEVECARAIAKLDEDAKQAAQSVRERMILQLLMQNNASLPG